LAKESVDYVPSLLVRVSLGSCIVLVPLLAWLAGEPQGKAPVPSKEVETAMAELRSLPGRVAAPGSAPRPCDDAALAQRGKSGERLWIEAFDVEALKALPAKPNRDWAWLNGLLARQFLGLDSDGKVAGGWQASRLHKVGMVALLSSSERRLPKMTNDNSFSGGNFKGALQIVDLVKGDVLCETPVVFASGSEVEYRTRGLFRKSAEGAVNDDFQSRAERAGTAALRRISKVAFVSTSGSWGD
jgi:hypothetical protein